MTTLLTLKEKVAKELGTFFTTTTTAADTDTGLGYKSCISTNLAHYPDGSLSGKWVELTTSTEQRMIENNWAIEGVVKPYKAFSTQIASGVTLDIFPYNPGDIKDAINRAITDAYPDLASPITDISLIGKNVLFNASFEDWASSSAPDYWTASVSTLAEETTEIKFAGSSIKVTNAGYAYQSHTQNRNLLDLEDSTVNFYCWAHAAAATTAYIEIYTLEQDGTATTTTSDAHTGGGEWEKLSIENLSIPDDLAVIQFRVKVVGAATAYFDNAYVAGTPSRYALPSQIDRVMRAYNCNSWETHGVSDQYPLDFLQWEQDGVKYISFGGEESAGDKIMLHGYAEHTELTTNASTITLNDKQEKAIIYGACAYLLRGAANAVSSQDNTNVSKAADKYEQRYEIYKERARSVVVPSRLRQWGSE